MRRFSLTRFIYTNSRLALLLSGSLLVLLGIGMLLAGQPTFAQDQTEPASYMGRRECADCHRDVSGIHVATAHHLTMQAVRGDQAEAVVADFSEGQDIRTVTLPGSDETRPFTLADVAYTVGSGRYVQRYLYAVDGEEYLVFPAEWNTLSASWQPLDLAADWPAAEYNWGTNCAYCHTTGYDVEALSWEETGVQCESCHGPGSTHIEVVEDSSFFPSAEELVDIRRSINSGIDPQVCGQCHSRGLSADGQYPFPAGYIPGEDLSAYFSLFAPEEDSAHWWSTGHASQPNMQYNEWHYSGHASSLEGLADLPYADDFCLGCHSGDYLYNQSLIAQVEAGERDGDAPDPVTLENAAYGITCQTCHTPHSGSEHPANLVTESYALCTSCHTNAPIPEHIHYPVQEMFEGLPLVENVAPRDNAHFIIEGGPDCQTCHMPEVPTSVAPENLAPRASHTMRIVSPGAALNVEGLVDSCSVCHSNLASPQALQQYIDDVQGDMRSRIDAARAALTDGTPEWVVNALDFVEGDGSLGIHNYAYADALLDAVDMELGLFAEGTAQAGQ
jgi:predicted CXXCH cytochrome family protein